MKKNNIKKVKISKEVLLPDFAKLVLSSTDDAIICTNVKGEITFWNKSAVNTFGYSREEVIGKSCSVIYSEEDLLSTNSKLQRVLKGENFSNDETIYLDKARNKVYALCTIKGIKNEQGEVYQVVAIAKNITKKKSVEIKLKETLSQNQLAIDVSKLGVWQLNVASGELLWNDQHLGFYGITSEEFSNDLEGFRDQLHTDDKDYVDSRFREVFEGKSVQGVNFRIIRPNDDIRYLSGSAAPIIIEGELVKVIGVIQDITARKTTEEDLKESLSRFNLAVDISKLGVWELNVDSGELLWNDQHLEFYGITREEFSNDLEGFRDQLHPDDKNYVDSRFQEVFEGKSVQDVNFRIIRPNGDIRYLSASAKPVFIDGKLIKLIGVNQDVTNQKIVEENLKETLSRLNLAVDTAKLGVWTLDLKTGELDWNDRLFEIYGVNPSEFNPTQQAFEKMLHPEDLESIMGDQENLSHGESRSDLEFRIIRPNNEVRYITGTVSPVFVDGEMGKLIGFNNDVTERKIDEENLKETLSRLNLAVDTAKLGIWSLDVMTGELLWNDEMFEIFATDPSEFDKTMDSFTKRVHPEDLEDVNGTMGIVLQNKSIFNVYFRIIRPNGKLRYIEASATPVFVDGKLDKVIGINRDITERKKAEKKLKESEARNRLFTQNVPDFLLQIDSTGKINYINKTLEGLQPKDVIGSSVYSWIPKKFIEKLKDKLEKVFSDGDDEIMEYPGNGLEGEPIWVEFKIGPLEKSGIITRVIIVSRDITNRKIVELNLNRALKENIELKQQIEAENIYLKEELKLESSFNEIVGCSKSLKKVLKQVEQVAKTDSTVLVLGETGTGKELIARAIHIASDRKDKSMVKVNCSALPADLIESELFGHEKGAFTGAINRKVGRFELANGGTIFLDEIGDFPISLQTRLLRVLQESEFERVGGEKTIKVDVRVITATNRNLAEQVLENKFRKDLYYRLNVFPITCPPLRDRVDDIQSLVHHFINKYNHKVNNKIKSVNKKTIERLMDYNWPGNIRELENVIERAVILSDGGQLQLGKWFKGSSIENVASDDLRTLETMECDYIIKVLEKTNWKIRGKNGAAEILGMQPTTLESRMKKRGIRR
jgi:PAS domain S-box-containing protein